VAADHGSPRSRVSLHPGYPRPPRRSPRARPHSKRREPEVRGLLVDDLESPDPSGVKPGRAGDPPPKTYAAGPAPS